MSQTDRYVLAGFLSTQEPFTTEHPEMRLTLADALLDAFDINDEAKPRLGLATTRELLGEITCRIDIDYFSGGGGLDYTTIKGRPIGSLLAQSQPVGEKENGLGGT